MILKQRKKKNQFDYTEIQKNLLVLYITPSLKSINLKSAVQSLATLV